MTTSSSPAAEASPASMSIAVCAKWVDLRPEVDALTGEYSPDVQRHGFSGSDRAALEVALQLAGEWSTSERSIDVVVVAAAPSIAEADLLAFAASGASSVRRIDVDGDISAGALSMSLAGASRDCDLVICGDMSADNGSGYVPAALAHARRHPSALGLTSVRPTGDRTIEVLRRLQGGYRERLAVSVPAVLSVEAGAASLRRAPLTALVGEGKPALTVVEPQSQAAPGIAELTRPWRPRPRELAAPSGHSALDRIVDLTGALVDRTPPKTLEAEPAEAAKAIMSQLKAWGYLDDASL